MIPRLTLALLCIISGSACTPSKHGKKDAITSPEVLEREKGRINFQQHDAAIRKIMTQQAKDWNDGDIDAFMRGYWQSDSLKFITKKGIRMGYDSVALNYKKSYNSKDKMGRLNFTDIAVTPLDEHGTIANVTGKWEVIQKDQALSGLFSLIFRQVNGEWKIIIDHTW